MSPGNSPGTPSTKKRYPAYSYSKGKSLKDYLSNKGKTRQRNREESQKDVHHNEDQETPSSMDFEEQQQQDNDHENCLEVKFTVDEKSNNGRICDVVTVAIGDEMDILHNEVTEEEVVEIPNLSYEEETPDNEKQEIILNTDKRGDIIEHSNEDYQEIIEISNDDYREIIEYSIRKSQDIVETEELQNCIDNEVPNIDYQEIIEISNCDYREIIEHSNCNSENSTEATFIDKENAPIGNSENTKMDSEESLIVNRNPRTKPIEEVTNSDYREVIDQSKAKRIKIENDLVGKTPSNSLINVETLDRNKEDGGEENLNVEDVNLDENLNTNENDSEANVNVKEIDLNTDKERNLVVERSLQIDSTIKDSNVKDIDLDSKEDHLNGGEEIDSNALDHDSNPEEEIVLNKKYDLIADKEIDFKRYMIVEESDLNGQPILNDVEFQTIPTEEDIPFKKNEIKEHLYEHALVNQTEEHSEGEQASEHHDGVCKILNVSDSLILHRDTKSTNQIAGKEDARDENQADGDSGFLTELFTKRDRNQSPIKTKETTG